MLEKLKKLANELNVEIEDREDFDTDKKFKGISFEAKGCDLFIAYYNNDEYSLQFDFRKSSKRCKAGNHFEEMGYNRAYEVGKIIFDSEVSDNKEVFFNTIEYIKTLIK